MESETADSSWRELGATTITHRESEREWEREERERAQPRSQVLELPESKQPQATNLTKQVSFLWNM